MAELVKVSHVLYEKCQGGFKSVSDTMQNTLDGSTTQLSSNVSDNQNALLYVLSVLYNLAVRGMVVNRQQQQDTLNAVIRQAQ